jgi:DNA-binding NarL/FixJ family response regulator
VRTHIKNIYEKLHVATMTEAVVKAIKSNLA